MKSPLQTHWNQIYARTSTDQLGWYEAQPNPSARLIGKCQIQQDENNLDLGAGAATLVDYLLAQNYTQLTAVDISEAALATVQSRLDIEKAALVKWIVDDLRQPSQVLALKNVAIWHDRAVFHFLTSETDRQTYWSTLNTVLKPNGYVILAAFTSGRHKKCSGLDVVNYDANSLATFLGKDFALLD